VTNTEKLTRNFLVKGCAVAMMWMKESEDDCAPSSLHPKELFDAASMIKYRGLQSTHIRIHKQIL
jgi:hypothetical protein